MSQTHFSSNLTEPSGVYLDPGEIGFILASDGEELKFRHYPGSRAVVIHLHGIEGHGLWFGATAAKLSKSGIAVFAFDRRGAGLNQNNRGHLPSWQQLVSDIDALVAHVSASYPNCPVFLVGNCWGAMAAIIYAAGNKKLSGLVLVAPALWLKVDVTWFEKLQIGLAFLTRRRKFFRTPLTTELFTDNPPYLYFLDHDPLRLKFVTGNLYIETVNLRRLFKQRTRELELPVLVLQPALEQIVKVEDVKRWFARVPATDKTWQLFANSQHSLDFDRNHQAYVDVLSNWILTHSQLANEGAT